MQPYSLPYFFWVVLNSEFLENKEYKNLIYKLTLLNIFSIFHSVQSFQGVESSIFFILFIFCLFVVPKP